MVTKTSLSTDPTEKGIKMRKEVIIPAIGWVLSGLVSIATWTIKAGRSVCNCPSIPVNASASLIRSICRCPSNNGLLYIGVFVMIVGASLMVFNKRIGRIIDFYKNKKRRTG